MGQTDSKSELNHNFGGQPDSALVGSPENFNLGQFLPMIFSVHQKSVSGLDLKKNTHNRHTCVSGGKKGKKGGGEVY